VVVSVMPAKTGAFLHTWRPISQFLPPFSRFGFRGELNDNSLISSVKVHLWARGVRFVREYSMQRRCVLDWRRATATSV